MTTQDEIETQAVELSETFINGNLSDVVLALRDCSSPLRAAALALRIGAMLPKEDRKVLIRLICNRL